MKVLLFVAAMAAAAGSNGQLYVESGSTLHLQPNSLLSVEGDIYAGNLLSGEGNIHLNGENLQRINFNGFAIPSISMNNTSGVELTGHLLVNNSINIMGGELLLNAFRLELSENAKINYNGEAGVTTNGSGSIRKKLNSRQTDFFVPLKDKATFTPLLIQTSGRYSNAYIDIISSARASSNKPADAVEIAEHFWKIDRHGIQGSVNALIQVSQDVARGDQESMEWYCWNNRDWILLDKPANLPGNTIRAAITGTGGEIFAMKRKEGVARRVSAFLYPNPAASGVTLQYLSEQDENGIITISDAGGRVVRTQVVRMFSGVNNIKLQVNDLDKGFYDVTLTNARGITTLKLARN